MLPLKYHWDPASVVTTTASAQSLQSACFVGEVCFVGAESRVPIPVPWLASCLCDPGDGSSPLGAFLLYQKGAGISSCGLSWVTRTCPGPLPPPALSMSWQRLLPAPPSGPGHSHLSIHSSDRFVHVSGGDALTDVLVSCICQNFQGCGSVSPVSKLTSVT